MMPALTVRLRRTACATLAMAALLGADAQQTDGAKDPDLDTSLDYLILRCTSLGSMRACEEALRLDPRSGRAHAGRAAILAAQDDNAGAIRAYRQALAADGAPPDVSERLEALRRQRRPVVESCLSATQPTSLPLCHEALLPGEEETYAIYVKIGDLQLADGALARAHSAFESAEDTRPSLAMGELLAILATAVECVEHEAVGECLAALQSVPGDDRFASARAQVTLAGCRALTQSAAHVADARARLACEEARVRNPWKEAVAEIDRLLAAAGPRSVRRDGVSECLALAGQAGPVERAQQACQRALQSASSDDRAQLLSVVANLELRSLAERCGDENAAPEVLQACQQARLGDARPTYRNDPLVLDPGVEAVTY